MDFGIRRLNLGGTAGATPYHLYERDDRLILVADTGTPWIVSDARQHVRFALPDGREVATLDLPWNGKAQAKKEARHNAYAIIQNHAVYAILNELSQPATGSNKPLPYYIIEVEAEMWLAIGQRLEGGTFDYALYDQVPTGMNTAAGLVRDDLPDPIGTIQTRGIIGDPPYDYTVNLILGRVTHTALIALALVFLIDRAERVG